MDGLQYNRTKEKSSIIELRSVIINREIAIKQLEKDSFRKHKFSPERGVIINKHVANDIGPTGCYTIKKCLDPEISHAQVYQ